MRSLNWRMDTEDSSFTADMKMDRSVASGAISAKPSVRQRQFVLLETFIPNFLKDDLPKNILSILPGAFFVGSVWLPVRSMPCP